MLVGSETYLLLKSSQLASEFTFDEITTKPINHLKLRRLTVAERFKFHQRNQNDGDVAKFAVELRRLASTCNFGDFLTEAPHDQFVCGIRNGNTQRKLLSEDRSFEQAMHTALADEAADAEAKQLHFHGNPGASCSILGAVGVKTKAFMQTRVLHITVPKTQNADKSKVLKMQWQPLTSNLQIQGRHLSLLQESRIYCGSLQEETIHTQ